MTQHKQKAAINPYRFAINAILHRILWDIHPHSWLSRKKIRKWQDRYSGQKAVILCNGPSLNHVKFDNLSASGVFTIGLNKINLLFGRSDFRPSVIVAVNPHVIEQNAEFYNHTDLPLFIDSKSRRWVSFRETVHYLHSVEWAGDFARDCSISINQGYTVTYVAMQLAFHMGFKEVALVGCDHSFTTQGPANRTVVAEEKDHNHFDPGYFSGGVKWQLPDLLQSEAHYKIARENFEKYGRRVVDCTHGGKLKVFERMPLGDFLGSTKKDAIG
ncbi:MAG: DUF115 domain-containing protein [Desulfobacteraceae bacterium]|nr:DUF115 domain-containing protein [Desulfobacteraceae bacterium]